MDAKTHASAVKSYYEHNTRAFLRHGKHGGSLNIHQALWAPGVETQAEAVSYSNELVRQQWDQSPGTAGTGHILDLGCGVGSSLLYLADHGRPAQQYLGVSISPQQIDIARSRVVAHPQKPDFQFHTADFLHLPSLPPIQMAYAIEAFVHAAHPEGFFEQVSQALAPGGRLVLVDDFLTEEGQAARNNNATARTWLDTYQSGWLAAALSTPAALARIASTKGLTLCQDEDLTHWMELGRLRDRLIGLMMKLWGKQMRRMTYFKSLTGGYAKQQCLQKGWMSYRILVFEKEA